MDNFNLLILAIILSVFALITSFLVYFYLKSKYEKKDEDSEISIKYEKKTIKLLTDEQKAEIHKRGHITPEEKLEEIESFGLCAPGDAIGGAAWRCKFFENCHECLCEYVASKDEWEPFEFKIANSVSDENVDFFIQKLE